MPARAAGLTQPQVLEVGESRPGQQQEKVAWIFLSQPYARGDGKAAALTFLLKDHGQTHCGYAIFRIQGQGWKLERLRKAEGSVNSFKD